MPRVLYRRANPRRRSGQPDWRSNGFPAGFSVVTTKIGVNEQSLDLYMEFTESAVKPTSVVVRARKSADASEEHAQADANIARWQGVVNPSIQGSILGLNASETWDVRWRFTFDDGSVTDYVWLNLTTSATKTYPAPGTLTPTRYLSPSGSDSNDGLTSGTAWATWQKAITSTPTAGIVQVADGAYESTANSGSGTNERNGQITIIPANPWVGDDGADLANGHRVIVEPPTRTSPTGGPGINQGVWSLVSVTGPGRFGNAVASYSLYKWSSVSFTNATFVTATYRSGQFADPDRLVHHYRDADYLSTAGGFGEYLYTNKRHRYGCWVDANGDIYCRIPNGTTDDGTAGADPNTLYLTFSGLSDTGISCKSGGNHRVNGVGFYGFGRGVYVGTGGCTVDHAFFGCCFAPLRIESSGMFAEHNRILDSNLTADTPSAKTLDWGAVKTSGIMADGTAYGSKIAGAAEGQIHASTSQQFVFGHNYVRGTFNGVGTTGSESTSLRFNGWGATIRNNVFTLIADDCIEPEDAMVCCWKIHGNRFEKSIDTISTGPLHGGLIYSFFNTVWRNNANYVGRQQDGSLSVGGKVYSKFSSQSEPQGRVYSWHNTICNDTSNADLTAPQVFGDSAGGTTSSGTKVHERHTVYGNLVIGTGNLVDEVDEQNSQEWDEDYNFWFSYSLTGGIKAHSKNYNNSTSSAHFANYRADRLDGTHSNLVGATTYELNDAAGGTTSQTFFEAQLASIATGDLTLAVGSALRNLVPACPVTARLAGAPFDVGATP